MARVPHADGAATRQRILAAARTLFLKRGYRATPMSHVAKAAGVTTPALYWHFASKDDLYFEVVHGEYASMLKALIKVSEEGSAEERLAAYAKLPDWSGIWRTKSVGLVSTSVPAPRKGKRDYPPYKPEWEARYVKDLALAEEQGSSRQAEPFVDTYTVYCTAGVPRNIGNVFDRFFIVAPEAVWMINGGEVRTIYTDGRQYPSEDEMFERFQGWSIGHWQRDTLVVETRSMKANLWGDTTPLHFSERAVLHERYRMTDRDTIVNDVTIDDPEAFTAPWHFQREYKRQDAGKWAEEKEICGGKEDFQKVVNGQLQVVPPAAGPASQAPAKP